MKKSIIYFIMCLVFLILFVLFGINLNENTPVSYFKIIILSFLICSGGACLCIALGKIIDK